jgi:hypothetical protein
MSKTTSSILVERLRGVNDKLGGQMAEDDEYYQGNRALMLTKSSSQDGLSKRQQNKNYEFKHFLQIRTLLFVFRQI